MIYVVYFSDAGAPATGFSPAIDIYVKVSDGTSAGVAPTVYELSGGAYKFTADPDEAVFCRIDAGATLSDDDRYKVVQITPDDHGISDIKLKTDNLPADPASMGILSDQIAGIWGRGTAPHSFGSLVYFGGLFWFCGGYDDASYTVIDTVYSSPDCITWTLKGTLPIAVYSPNVIVFGSYLVVTGGYDSGWAANNALYYSTDGVNWSTGVALPEESTGCNLLSFDSKLWKFGGTSASTGVYYTTNFSSWTKTADLPDTIAHAGACVMSSKMWIVGGYGASGGWLDDVYSSTNGVTWNNVGSLPKTMYGQFVIPYNGEMLLFGGIQDPISGDDIEYNHTKYSSSDGVTWNNTGTFPYTAYYYNYPAITPVEYEFYTLITFGRISNDRRILYTDVANGFSYWIEAGIENHVTNSLNIYDPPTKAELDAAEADIIAAIPTATTKVVKA